MQRMFQKHSAGTDAAESRQLAVCTDLTLYKLHSCFPSLCPCERHPEPTSTAVAPMLRPVPSQAAPSQVAPSQVVAAVGRQAAPDRTAAAEA